MIARLLVTSSLALVLSLPAHSMGPKGAGKTGFSPRFLLKDYIQASQMIGRCPQVVQSKAIAEKRSSLEQFGKDMKAALIERTQKLRPDLDEQAATQLIEDWLSNQIFEMTHVQSNAKFCARSDAEQISVAIDLLTHPSVAASMKEYGKKEVSVLTKVPFEGNKSAKSFALPEFQGIALDILKEHHFGMDCGAIEVTDVSVEDHQAAGAGELAPFEVATLRVKEIWTAACGDQSKQFSVEFDRSIEEARGRSIIARN